MNANSKNEVTLETKSQRGNSWSYVRVAGELDYQCLSRVFAKKYAAHKAKKLGLPFYNIKKNGAKVLVNS